MNKKIIIVLIVGVLFFAIGFGTSYFTQKEVKVVTAPAKTEQKTYEQGWEDATERIKQLNVEFLDQENVPVKIVVGDVTETKANSIMVKIKQFDQFADPSLDTREVETTAGTEILKVVKKDVAEFQREENEYNEKLAQGLIDDQEDQPPAEFKKITVDRSQLSAGQYVQVWANEDIREAKKFMAAKIIIQYRFN